MSTRTALWRNGLWDANPGLVQLLGLCPLLAVSNTAVNGLGLGLATLFVLVLSNLAVSGVRRWLADEIRIPAFVLVIATLVTVVDLLTRAYFPGLAVTLGIFVPLIVTNCTILARAEALASRSGPVDALIDGLAQGLGFAAVLLLLGAGREILGQGTLFADAELLFGAGAARLEIHFPIDGVLLAVLPPGAFIGLGLMVALHRRLDRRRPGRVAEGAPEDPAAEAAP